MVSPYTSMKYKLDMQSTPSLDEPISRRHFRIKLLKQFRHIYPAQKLGFSCLTYGLSHVAQHPNFSEQEVDHHQKKLHFKTVHNMTHVTRVSNRLPSHQVILGNTNRSNNALAFSAPSKEQIKRYTEQYHITTRSRSLRLYT